MRPAALFLEHPFAVGVHLEAAPESNAARRSSEETGSIAEPLPPDG